MLSTATQWPRIQFSISNSSSSGSITPSDIQDFDFRSVLLFLKFSISQELYLILGYLSSMEISERHRKARKLTIDSKNSAKEIISNS